MSPKNLPHRKAGKAATLRRVESGVKGINLLGAQRRIESRRALVSLVRQRLGVDGLEYPFGNARRRAKRIMSGLSPKRLNSP